MNNEIFIVDALRTPIGKYGGLLAKVRADDLMAACLKAIISRNHFMAANDVEFVIVGDGNQAGEDCRNIARMSTLLASFPPETVGISINSLCGSGIHSVIDAAKTIYCGEANVIIAGGVENMSRAPIARLKPNTAWIEDSSSYDSTIGWRFINPTFKASISTKSMGELAATLAVEMNITRQQQDEFTYQSYQKYFASKANNIWQQELIAMESVNNKTFVEDENPREISMDYLSKLKPVFEPKEAGITAANASGINDGAASILLCSKSFIHSKNIKAAIKIRSWATVGVAPDKMGIAPVDAIKKAIQQAELNLEEIDWFEINESFAATTLACINLLKIDGHKVNPNGGSLALGNPVGMTGTRIIGSLFHQMQRTNCKFGIAATCVGMGLGVAILLEKDNPIQ